MLFLSILGSVDELRKILNDRDAYITFLNSLEQVKIPNNVSFNIGIMSLFSFLMYVIGNLWMEYF